MNDLTKVIARRKRQDAVFNLVGIACLLIGLVTLAALIVDMAIDGLPRIDWQFMTSYPSRFASQSGILSSWVGTLLIMTVTAGSAVPLGIAAGVYLEEYAPKNKLTNLI
ncbi:MAG TPA: phosphate ABC transporter, permease protein PstA, partial [Blastocatellia bacterium]|nr:phosphate ABC transporter, permease protein PstA [Blastocatellia bacterium]